MFLCESWKNKVNNLKIQKWKLHTTQPMHLVLAVSKCIFEISSSSHEFLYNQFHSNNQSKKKLLKLSSSMKLQYQSLRKTYFCSIKRTDLEVTSHFITMFTIVLCSRTCPTVYSTIFMWQWQHHCRKIIYVDIYVNRGRSPILPFIVCFQIAKRTMPAYHLYIWMCRYFVQWIFP